MFLRVEQAFGLLVLSRVDQVGDGQHLAMKRRVQVERGVILRRAAQVQRVFADQPFADRTLLRMLDERVARSLSGSCIRAANSRAIFHRTWLAIASRAFSIVFAI